ncbi:hypothetical protein M422DRAFT_36580 [Sphaerobolus stellatus SS14]|uniref:Uncharacterized protein n=1 Tax=Sphaerobolus stellatus (strain SS14) TaxID=990650 RepID=A0A0C9UNE8_SPHS4|nr:hypothetical protein M422DRAFT_36580 [Sphaerobolus stellatus SS14]
MVWQRRRDSGLGNGSGERRWCGPSSDGDGREVTTPTHVRPYMHMPVSLHDGPPHEYYHPIHLLQHRYALLLNNYGQYTSVFSVPHHQHIAATMPTSSSKRQSVAARQHTADTTIDTHHYHIEQVIGRF